MDDHRGRRSSGDDRSRKRNGSMKEGPVLFPRYYPDWYSNPYANNWDGENAEEEGYYYPSYEYHFRDPNLYDNTYLGQRSAKSHAYRLPAESEGSEEFSKSKKKICGIIVAIFASVCLVAIALGIGIYFGVVEPSRRTTPDTKVQSVTFLGSLTINRTFTPGLNDSNSTEYKDLAKNVTDEVDNSYRSSSLRDVYGYSNVTGFSSGSIIAHMQIHFTADKSSGTAVTADSINTTLNQQLKQSSSSFAKEIIPGLINLIDITVSTTPEVTTRTPTTAASTTQASTTAATTTSAPATVASTTQSSTTAAPTTQSSTTAAPTTQSSTTAAPTTQSSTTAAPTTQSSTTAAPTTQSSTTAVPTTQSSTTAAPTTQSSTTAAPTTQSSTTAAPTTQSSTTAASTPQASTTASTTKASTTAAATTNASTTALPTTQASTTASTTKATTTAAPTTQSSTTAAPTTQSSTTAAPTTQSSTTTTSTPQASTTASTTKVSTTAAATTNASTTAVPTTQALTTASTTKAPTTAAPTTQASTAASTTQASTTASTTKAPTTASPTTSAPVTIASTTQTSTTASTTKASTTAATTTNASTTAAPTTQSSTTAASTTQSSTTSPSTKAPTTAASTTQASTTASTTKASTAAPVSQASTTAASTTQASTTASTTKASITAASTTQASTTASTSKVSTTAASTTQASTTASTTKALTTAAPISQASTTVASTTQASTTASTTKATTTAAPTTSAPATAGSTTQASTTASTTKASTTAASTTQASTTASTTKASTTADPMSQASATAASTTQASITASTNKATTTASPTTSAPATVAPTTQTSTTAASTTLASTSASTTKALTTAAPTTSAPTTALQTIKVLTTSALTTVTPHTSATTTPMATTTMIYITTTEVITTTLANVVDIVELNMTLNQTFNEKLRDENSTEYQTLKNQSEAYLTVVLKANNSTVNDTHEVDSVQVLGFEPGSLIIKSQILFRLVKMYFVGETRRSTDKSVLVEMLQSGIEKVREDPKIKIPDVFKNLTADAVTEVITLEVKVEPCRNFSKMEEYLLGSNDGAGVGLCEASVNMLKGQIQQKGGVMDNDSCSMYHDMLDCLVTQFRLIDGLTCDWDNSFIQGGFVQQSGLLSEIAGQTHTGKYVHGQCVQIWRGQYKFQDLQTPGVAHSPCSDPHQVFYTAKYNCPVQLETLQNTNETGCKANLFSLTDCVKSSINTEYNQICREEQVADVIYDNQDYIAKSKYDIKFLRTCARGCNAPYIEYLVNSECQGPLMLFDKVKPANQCRLFEYTVSCLTFINMLEKLGCDTAGTAVGQYVAQRWLRIRERYPGASNYTSIPCNVTGPLPTLAPLPDLTTLETCSDTDLFFHIFTFNCKAVLDKPTLLGNKSCSYHWKKFDCVLNNLNALSFAMKRNNCSFDNVRAFMFPNSTNNGTMLLSKIQDKLTELSYPVDSNEFNGCYEMYENLVSQGHMCDIFLSRRADAIKEQCSSVMNKSLEMALKFPPELKCWLAKETAICARTIISDLDTAGQCSLFNISILLNDIVFSDMKNLQNQTATFYSECSEVQDHTFDNLTVCTSADLVGLGLLKCADILSNRTQPCRKLDDFAMCALQSAQRQGKKCDPSDIVVALIKYEWLLNNIYTSCHAGDPCTDLVLMEEAWKFGGCSVKLDQVQEDICSAAFSTVECVAKFISASKGKICSQDDIGMTLMSKMEDILLMAGVNKTAIQEYVQAYTGFDADSCPGRGTLCPIDTFSMLLQGNCSAPLEVMHNAGTTESEICRAYGDLLECLAFHMMLAGKDQCKMRDIHNTILKNLTSVVYTSSGRSLIQNCQGLNLDTLQARIPSLSEGAICSSIPTIQYYIKYLACLRQLDVSSLTDDMRCGVYFGIVNGLRMFFLQFGFHCEYTKLMRTIQEHEANSTQIDKIFSSTFQVDHACQNLYDNAIPKARCEMFMANYSCEVFECAQPSVTIRNKTVFDRSLKCSVYYLSVKCLNMLMSKYEPGLTCNYTVVGQLMNKYIDDYSTLSHQNSTSATNFTQCTALDRLDQLGDICESDTLVALATMTCPEYLPMVRSNMSMNSTHVTPVPNGQFQNTTSQQSCSLYQNLVRCGQEAAASLGYQCRVSKIEMNFQNSSMLLMANILPQSDVPSKCSVTGSLFSVKIHLNIEWKDLLADQSSAEHKELVGKIGEKMTNLVSDSQFLNDVESVRVISIGSTRGKFVHVNDIITGPSPSPNNNDSGSAKPPSSPPPQPTSRLGSTTPPPNNVSDRLAPLQSTLPPHNNYSQSFTTLSSLLPLPTNGTVGSLPPRNETLPPPPPTDKTVGRRRRDTLSDGGGPSGTPMSTSSPTLSVIGIPLPPAQIIVLLELKMRPDARFTEEEVRMGLSEAVKEMITRNPNAEIITDIDLQSLSVYFSQAADPCTDLVLMEMAWRYGGCSVRLDKVQEDLCSAAFSTVECVANFISASKGKTCTQDDIGMTLLSKMEDILLMAGVDKTAIQEYVRAYTGFDAKSCPGRGTLCPIDTFSMLLQGNCSAPLGVMHNPETTQAEICGAYGDLLECLAFHMMLAGKDQCKMGDIHNTILKNLTSVVYTSSGRYLLQNCQELNLDTLQARIPSLSEGAICSSIPTIQYYVKYLACLRQLDVSSLTDDMRCGVYFGIVNGLRMFFLQFGFHCEYTKLMRTIQEHEANSTQVDKIFSSTLQVDHACQNLYDNAIPKARCEMFMANYSCEVFECAQPSVTIRNKTIFDRSLKCSVYYLSVKCLNMLMSKYEPGLTCNYTVVGQLMNKYIDDYSTLSHQNSTSATNFTQCTALDRLDQLGDICESDTLVALASMTCPEYLPMVRSNMSMNSTHVTPVPNGQFQNTTSQQPCSLYQNLVRCGQDAAASLGYQCRVSKIEMNFQNSSMLLMANILPQSDVPSKCSLTGSLFNVKIQLNMEWKDVFVDPSSAEHKELVGKLHQMTNLLSDSQFGKDMESVRVISIGSTHGKLVTVDDITTRNSTPPPSPSPSDGFGSGTPSPSPNSRTDSSLPPPSLLPPHNDSGSVRPPSPPPSINGSGSSTPPPSPFNGTGNSTPPPSPPPPTNGSRSSTPPPSPPPPINGSGSSTPPPSPPPPINGSGSSTPPPSPPPPINGSGNSTPSPSPPHINGSGSSTPPPSPIPPINGSGSSTPPPSPPPPINGSGSSTPPPSPPPPINGSGSSTPPPSPPPPINGSGNSTPSPSPPHINGSGSSTPPPSPIPPINGSGSSTPPPSPPPPINGSGNSTPSPSPPPPINGSGSSTPPPSPIPPINGSGSSTPPPSPPPPINGSGNSTPSPSPPPPISGSGSSTPPPSPITPINGSGSTPSPSPNNVSDRLSSPQTTSPLHNNYSQSLTTLSSTPPLPTNGSGGSLPPYNGTSPPPPPTDKTVGRRRRDTFSDGGGPSGTPMSTSSPTLSVIGIPLPPAQIIVLLELKMRTDARFTEEEVRIGLSEAVKEMITRNPNAEIITDIDLQSLSVYFSQGTTVDKCRDPNLIRSAWSEQVCQADLTTFISGDRISMCREFSQFVTCMMRYIHDRQMQTCTYKEVRDTLVENFESLLKELGLNQTTITMVLYMFNQHTCYSAECTSDEFLLMALQTRCQVDWAVISNVNIDQSTKCSRYHSTINCIQMIIGNPGSCSDDIILSTFISNMDYILQNLNVDPNLIRVTFSPYNCTSSKPGFCPVSVLAGTCVNECTSDYACNGSQKCCSNNCGYTCQNPVSKPQCPTETFKTLIFNNCSGPFNRLQNPSLGVLDRCRSYEDLLQCIAFHMMMSGNSMCTVELIHHSLIQRYPYFLTGSDGVSVANCTNTDWALLQAEIPGPNNEEVCTSIPTMQYYMKYVACHRSFKFSVNLMDEVRCGIAFGIINGIQSFFHGFGFNCEFTQLMSTVSQHEQNSTLENKLLSPYLMDKLQTCQDVYFNGSLSSNPRLQCAQIMANYSCPMVESLSPLIKIRNTTVYTSDLKCSVYYEFIKRVKTLLNKTVAYLPCNNEMLKTMVNGFIEGYSVESGQNVLQAPDFAECTALETVHQLGSPCNQDTLVALSVMFCPVLTQSGSIPNLMSPTTADPRIGSTQGSSGVAVSTSWGQFCYTYQSLVQCGLQIVNSTDFGSGYNCSHGDMEILFERVERDNYGLLLNSLPGGLDPVHCSRYSPMFSIELKLEMEWTDSLNNVSSPEYMGMIQKIQQSMDRLVNESFLSRYVAEVKVIQIGSWSGWMTTQQIDVNLTVMMKPTARLQPEEVSGGLIRAVREFTRLNPFQEIIPKISLYFIYVQPVSSEPSICTPETFKDLEGTACHQFVNISLLMEERELCRMYIDLLKCFRLYMLLYHENDCTFSRIDRIVMATDTNVFRMKEGFVRAHCNSYFNLTTEEHNLPAEGAVCSSTDMIQNVMSQCHAKKVNLTTLDTDSLCRVRIGSIPCINETFASHNYLCDRDKIRSTILSLPVGNGNCTAVYSAANKCDRYMIENYQVANHCGIIMFHITKSVIMKKSDLMCKVYYEFLNCAHSAGSVASFCDDLQMLDPIARGVLKLVYRTDADLNAYFDLPDFSNCTGLANATVGNICQDPQKLTAVSLANCSLMVQMYPYSTCMKYNYLVSCGRETASALSSVGCDLETVHQAFTNNSALVRQQFPNENFSPCVVDECISMENQPRIAEAFASCGILQLWSKLASEQSFLDSILYDEDLICRLLKMTTDCLVRHMSQLMGVNCNPAAMRDLITSNMQNLNQNLTNALQACPVTTTDLSPVCEDKPFISKMFLAVNEYILSYYIHSTMWEDLCMLNNVLINSTITSLWSYLSVHCTSLQIREALVNQTHFLSVTANITDISRCMGTDACSDPLLDVCEGMNKCASLTYDRMPDCTTWLGTLKYIQLQTQKVYDLKCPLESLSKAYYRLTKTDAQKCLVTTYHEVTYTMNRMWDPIYKEVDFYLIKLFMYGILNEVKMALALKTSDLSTLTITDFSEGEVSGNGTIMVKVHMIAGFTIAFSDVQLQQIFVGGIMTRQTNTSADPLIREILTRTITVSNQTFTPDQNTAFCRDPSVLERVGNMYCYANWTGFCGESTVQDRIVRCVYDTLRSVQANCSFRDVRQTLMSIPRISKTCHLLVREGPGCSAVPDPDNCTATCTADEYCSDGKLCCASSSCASNVCMKPDVEGFCNTYDNIAAVLMQEECGIRKYIPDGLSPFPDNQTKCSFLMNATQCLLQDPMFREICNVTEVVNRIASVPAQLTSLLRELNVSQNLFGTNFNHSVCASYRNMTGNITVYQYSGVLTLEREYQPELLNRSSLQFRNLDMEIIRELNRTFYSGNLNRTYLNSSVRGFRNGSVIVYFESAFSANISINDVLNTLIVGLVSSNSSIAGEIRPNSASILNQTEEGMTACRNESLITSHIQKCANESAFGNPANDKNCTLFFRGLPCVMRPIEQKYFTYCSPGDVINAINVVRSSALITVALGDFKNAILQCPEYLYLEKLAEQETIPLPLGSSHP